MQNTVTYIHCIKTFGGILLWVVDFLQLMFINSLRSSVRLISLKEKFDCVMFSLMFIILE